MEKISSIFHTLSDTLLGTPHESHSTDDPTREVVLATHPVPRDPTLDIHADPVHAAATSAEAHTSAKDAYKPGEATSYTPPDAYKPVEVLGSVKAPTPKGVRRIVVCCDGTWNSSCSGNDLPSMGGVTTNCASTPTNIFKVAFLAGCCDPIKEHPNQLVYYHAGVGAAASRANEDILEGLFGNIDKELLDAYRWLAAVYKEGDEIYAFGFSRGATVVRSLFGLIRNAGLIRRDGLSDAEYDKVGFEAYEVYRGRPAHPELDVAGSEAYEKRAKEFREAHGHMKVNLKFLGVFDTVGELGVPKGMVLGSLIEAVGERLNMIYKASFHDTKVSDEVQFAYHALSIDETRELFAPTLFENTTKKPAHREQVWFRGGHSDVGGGWFEQGLPNIALQWMLAKAREAGLELKDLDEYEKVTQCLMMGVRPEHIENNFKAYVVHDPFLGKEKGTFSVNERIFRDFEYYQDPTRFFPSTLHPSVFKVALDVPPPLNLHRYLKRTDPKKLSLWPKPPTKTLEQQAQYEIDRIENNKKIAEKDGHVH